MTAPRIVVTLFAAVALASGIASDARAQDFFQSLFGYGPYGARPYPYGAGVDDAYPPARRSTRAQRARAAKPAHRVARPAAIVETPRAEGFCVRSCDGYYFPLVMAGHDSPQEACDLACPSARVSVYEGATIEAARGPDGDRYTALPTAFSFRDKRSRACSCNPPEGSQAYALRMLRQDPTLRAGDIIYDKHGAFVYDGAGFAPAERSALLTAATRAKIRAQLAAAAAAPHRPMKEAALRPIVHLAAPVHLAPPAQSASPAADMDPAARLSGRAPPSRESAGPVVAMDIGESALLGPALVSLRRGNAARLLKGSAAAGAAGAPEGNALPWISALLAFLAAAVAARLALRRPRPAVLSKRAARLAKL